jgi:NADH-quinone oxidoreductase subunit M
VVLALPNNAKLVRWFSAIVTVPPLLMAIWLFNNFDRTTAKFQFVEDYHWIPAYNISYTMGVDGLSISMVLLTALLCFICILLPSASKRRSRVTSLFFSCSMPA